MRALPALVLLVLAACTGDRDNTCVATRDCPRGERCVESECVERTATRCARSEDCGPGGVCTDRVCFGGTACASPEDCGPGERCDTVQGLCIVADCDALGRCPNAGACDFTRKICGQPVTCETDAECLAPTGRCAGGYCAPNCRKFGCAANETCDGATGACVPGETGCATDAACDAPAGICEAGACVAGCATGGAACADGKACNTNTGRCEGGAGECSGDAACGAPAGICEGGRCVASCAGGGPACGGSTTCNATTGRCEGGAGGCTTDAQCGAGKICAGGTCGPGCQATGCLAFEACDTTGRCLPKGCSTAAQCGAPAGRCVNGTCIAGCGTSGCSSGTCTAATGECQSSDGSCVTNADCQATHYCHAPDNERGFCTKACGTSADCPTGASCLGGGGVKGVKACFANPTGTLPPGSSCASANECRSGLCGAVVDVNNPNAPARQQCIESCVSDAHCPVGTRCAAIFTSADEVVQVCLQNIPGVTGGYGEECSVDCASTFCHPAEDSCFEGCCSSAACPTGHICFPMKPISTLTAKQVTSSVLGCTPAFLGPATGAVGVRCTLSGGARDGANCRSNICIGSDADGNALPAGEGYCSDTCCSDRDCGTGFACIAASLDEGVAFPVCARVPR